ncbi:mannitol dehydrogenase family protein [Ornithinicoccus hortensis]|uniref:Fructuronate reductase n=1 Tax=Ornithinicoccus hortensis TaxID=82346 RepID=A0A542YP77_9MICO|nr:mannitol dehydrogenase family protein [Ornithinicoccus hortensis]TQL49724.1 fructuronate reductase [Ornithinicoccus hortensis]
MTPLTRAEHGRPPAPVRMVHLGVGNFFRAHQAWFTEHAPDAADWGYAAFTGRSATIAEELGGQDNLYTLLVREVDGDRPEVISSLTAVHPGGDLGALRGYFASPDLALVTSTVTEAGYRRDSSGGLDLSDPDVQADIAALREDPAADAVRTTPGRLVAGLLARRAAGAGALALVPCDNVPDNGAMVGRVVRELAAEVDDTLVPWIEQHVGVVTTMVDRITPRATDEDRAAVAEATGVDDPQAVVTEPFAEWVLAGEFPAGRPAWDRAGATFVDDVRLHEERKLWFLNGAHSLMAYTAPLRGHETVAEAIADPTVRGWVEDWWDLAAGHLKVDEAAVAAYREALLDRFANHRIRHLLAQIAADGSQKVPIRFGPVLAAEAAAGNRPEAVTRPVAAWLAHLHGHGVPVQDAQEAVVGDLAAAEPADAVRTLLGWMGVDPDPALVEQVLAQAAGFEEAV